MTRYKKFNSHGRGRAIPAPVCLALFYALSVPIDSVAEDAIAPLDTLEIAPPPNSNTPFQMPAIPPPLRALPRAEPVEQHSSTPEPPPPAAAPSLSGRFSRALAEEPQLPVREQVAEDRFAVPTPAPVQAAPPPAATSNKSAVQREKFPVESATPPSPRAPPANTNAGRETAVEHAKKHQDATYVCPMHPSFTTTNPSDKCPICGMHVVPIESDGDAEVVRLSPTVVNSLGVRTEKVKRRNLYRKITTVGTVDYDQNKMRSITLRTEAWVERLRTKSVGEQVRKGDVLFDAYSPVLVSAQEEYLNALEIEGGDGRLVRATAQRLSAFGFSDQQIARLAKHRKAEDLLTFYAPFTGIISELNIREGGYIAPATPVMVLADLSTVWLIAEVFENQVGWLQAGLQAEAVLPGLADKQLQGMVDYIYPTVDMKTRTVKVRIVFENKDGLLKPNMYANTTIFGSPRKKVLNVAREAIIRSGNRSRVILALADGAFKPVSVSLGVESDDRVEILAGLDEDAEVVVSSQFLIDSESSVRAALMRMGGL
ncbi:MAG: efflux RND transporter periplasmic adaptor subunit [Pseudomonadota bacterium]